VVQDSSMSVADSRARDQFVEYYARESATAEARAHFMAIRDLLLRIYAAKSPRERPVVGDIGCGAGTFSLACAESGCDVLGVDINEALIEIARERTPRSCDHVEFNVASAQSLPWPDTSVDIVVLPELLEHVPDWKSCLQEALRVLRHGGIIYLSTTNVLCPKQAEFALPMYSWYPETVKQWCVKKSLTTHPHWVNHAKFPAVNWFSPFSLSRYLEQNGIEAQDRFDVMELYSTNQLKRSVARAAGITKVGRLLGHMCTPYTVLVGHKG
jgi:2-polyprenyl-3-methyl-5-hydroxy-6-metoxy-1,4-benzoquinol methylase